MCPLCEIKDTTEHVLNWGINTDKRQKNIKNNTEEEWEEVVQIFRENKKKEKKEQRKLEEEPVQIRWSCTTAAVDVLALNWFAQSQDLCWGDAS